MGLLHVFTALCHSSFSIHIGLFCAFCNTPLTDHLERASKYWCAPVGGLAGPAQQQEEVKEEAKESELTDLCRSAAAAL